MKKLLSILFVSGLGLFPLVTQAVVVAGDVVCTRCVGTTDLADNGVTSAKILNGTILNADINAAAAIDPTKILGTAWTGSNDGSASGLDADQLDGVDSSVFLRNNTSGTINGVLTASGFWAGSTPPSGVLLWLDGGSADGVGRVTSASSDAYMDVTASQGGTGDKNAAVRLGSDGNWSGYIGVNGSDADKIQIGYNAGTVGTNVGMTLDQTGKVGIGTTSPDARLHLYGASPDLRIEDTDDMPTIFFDDSGSSSRANIRVGDGSNSNNEEDALYINSANDDIIFQRGDATTEAMRILGSSGNVGIGTTSPNRLLHLSSSASDVGVRLEGTSTASDYYLYSGVGGTDKFGIYDEDAAADRLVIDNAGNVGIGTISPGLKVDIGSVANGLATSGSTATGGLRLHGAAPGYNTVLDFGVSAGSGTNAWLQSTDATDLSQKYNLLLNPNGGNVGIGTTSPVKPLTVYAGSNDPLYLLSDSNHSWYVGPNVVGQRFGIYDATDSKLKMKIDSSGDMCFGACD